MTSHAEQFLVRVTSDGIATDASGRQYRLVPVEAADELLQSMAIRSDHGLGVPGYYDQPLFTMGGLSHKRRFEAAIRSMRQLHEEVVGTGFYRAATVDLAGMAVKVPERRALRADDGTDSCNACWNAAIDAMELK